MKLFPTYKYIVSFKFILAGNAGIVEQDIRVTDEDSLQEMVELTNTIAKNLAEKNVPSVPRISLGAFGKTDTVVHLQNIAGITFTIHPISAEYVKPVRGLTQNQ